jgi:hypothetical protein
MKLTIAALSAIMLVSVSSVAMLNVVILSIMMLNVVGALFSTFSA